jgi:2'-5' RNA ligase
MQLGYVIPVSIEMHDAMRKLQLRLLKEHGSGVRIEGIPHITLKQAFEIEEVEPFERHLETLVSETAPFDVHVRDAGLFEEGIVFLGVVETPPLVALRKRIVGDLATRLGIAPNPLEGDRYRFHVTLAEGLEPSSLRRARKDLQETSPDFRFRCDTVGLLLHTGREWISYKSSKFLHRDPSAQSKLQGREG